MPGIGVASSGSYGAGSRGVEGEVEGDGAIATSSIGGGIGGSGRSSVGGVVPSVRIAGGDRQGAAVAMENGEVERYDRVAALLVDIGMGGIYRAVVVGGTMPVEAVAGGNGSVGREDGTGERQGDEREDRGDDFVSTVVVDAEIVTGVGFKTIEEDIAFGIVAIDENPSAGARKFVPDVIFGGVGDLVPGEGNGIVGEFGDDGVGSGALRNIAGGTAYANLVGAVEGARIGRGGSSVGDIVIVLIEIDGAGILGFVGSPLGTGDPRTCVVVDSNHQVVASIANKIVVEIDSHPTGTGT